MPKPTRIVLVETSHAGNIGGVARAMKNMCQTDLALVNPLQFPSEQSSARASGADDVLEQASIHQDLEQAVGDCSLVIGASARLRTVRWPQLTPRQCAQAISQHQGSVALVFGRERSGLTNEELDCCHQLVHIPSNPQFGSLNLAMAVQVLTYELMVADAATAEPARHQSVNAEDMYALFGHLEQALADIGFMDPRKSDKLMRRLKRLFYRAAPDADEMKILRGILSAAQGRKSARRE